MADRRGYLEEAKKVIRELNPKQPKRHMKLINSLNYGDQKKIADKLGIHPVKVNNVLNGRSRDFEGIIKEVEKWIGNQEKSETI
jgi:hypothetical protein